MITALQYFGSKPHNEDQRKAADDLLSRVNALLDHAATFGIYAQIDPDTGTQISGSKGGAGDGGFRLQTATTGSGKSSHKEGKGVDVYDPDGAIDGWLDDFERDGGQNSMLEKFDLYRELPGKTVGWCHLSSRRPMSGRRTFIP